MGEYNAYIPVVAYVCVCLLLFHEFLKRLIKLEIIQDGCLHIIALKNIKHFYPLV